MRVNALECRSSLQGRRGRHAVIIGGVLLLAILLMPVPLAANAAESSTLAVVRAGGTELNAAPGGKVLQTLPTGAALQATGRTADGGWLMVTTEDGTAGWVLASHVVAFTVDFLPVTSDWQPPAAQAGGVQPAALAATATMTGTVTTVGQGLNVRSGPGTNYPIVGVEASGATVALIGRGASSAWLQIRMAGQDEIGWVAAAFVRSTGDLAQLPVSKQVGAVPAASNDAPIPAPSAATAGLSGKLVFQTTSGGTIYVYDFATAALRSLTTGADPAISPDGTMVAFWRQEGGEHSLYVINVAGGQPQRVLTRPEKLRSPTWSPDGHSLAFSHVNGQDVCRDTGQGICLPDVFPYNRMYPAVYTDKWSLAAVNRDGGDYHDIPSISGVTAPDWGARGLVYGAAGIQLTQNGGDSNANHALLNEPRFNDPAWRPQGDRVVFQSLEKDHWEIFTAGVGPQGAAAAPVALTRPATTLVPKLPQNVAPTWSPDGNSIAFLSNRSGKWTIWVMNADGSNQRPLPIAAPIEYQNQEEQVLTWGR